MKEQLTREDIKAHQGSKQESPSLETAVLVASLQDIKDFGWINLSSNTCIFQHIVMPSAFGEKNIVFLNRVGVITGEGIILGSTLRVPPTRQGNGPLTRRVGRLWASAGKPGGCCGGLAREGALSAPGE